MADEKLKLRVLVVDDDLLHCTIVTHYLNRNGYDSVYAMNGKEALILAMNDFKSGNPFQVCLVDYVITDMSGVTVAKRLKILDPNILIIAYTAYASYGIKKTLYDSRCITYIFTKQESLDGLKSIMIMIKKYFKREKDDTAPGTQELDITPMLEQEFIPTDTPE